MQSLQVLTQHKMFIIFKGTEEIENMKGQETIKTEQI